MFNRHPKDPRKMIHGIVS